MYRAVPEEKVDKLRTVAREDPNYWIYDTWDGAINDTQRLRAFVPNAEALDLMTYLKRFHRTFFADSTMADLRFLKTAGNAPDQLPRREFCPVPPGPASLNVCSLPGHIFLATRDGTYIYAYGWNNHVPLQSNEQIVELNKGDVMMLRGDCIFAMAGSAATNLCIHAYLDTPHFARPEYPTPEIMEILDDTRDADDIFCFAWNCPFIGGTKQSLYKHLNNFHRFFFNQPREVMP